MKKVVIIGAGPAGLSCAWQIVKKDKSQKYEVVVLEKDAKVGGLAKTVDCQGFKFDVGGHRFYTKIKPIDNLYKNLLKRDMLKRNRLSRIYYQEKYFNYPLSGKDVLQKIGFDKGILIFLSFIKRQFHRYQPEDSFKKWVSNRFGDELFELFFRTYTEKVWGVSTENLSAKWAQERIQNFSLIKAVLNAFFKINPFEAKTIITEFLYPKYGPGMFYEKLKTELEKKGGHVYLESPVIGIRLAKNKIIGVITKKNGKERFHSVDFLVSTMPVNQLVLLLRPSVKIKSITQKLKFRSFISVNLIVYGKPFPDNWIYIQNPNVKVGRVQNFYSWSPYMSRDRKFSPIGMEYFCNQNDDLWNMKDNDLVKLACSEAEKISLFRKKSVKDGSVYRVKDAYPIYDLGFETPLYFAKKHLQRFTNLFVAGRGGLFRYNNMDHSILSGFIVADNILSGSKKFDVWSIDEQKSYLEEKI